MGWPLIHSAAGAEAYSEGVNQGVFTLLFVVFIMVPMQESPFYFNETFEKYLIPSG